MKKQILVQTSDIFERNFIYNYIHNKYHFKEYLTKEEMLNSKFPFVIDFSKKDFWVCESITCCACAAMNKQIISIEEFLKLERK